MCMYLKMVGFSKELVLTLKKKQQQQHTILNYFSAQKIHLDSYLNSVFERSQLYVCIW